MEFPDFNTFIEGESDLWGWMADKFEVAKVPFLPTPPQTPPATTSEKAVGIKTETPTLLPPSIIPVQMAPSPSTPIVPTKGSGHLQYSSSQLANAMVPSVITSSMPPHLEKWVTLETPKNLIQKKQFNEKCLEMLTDITAFAHNDPPTDLISSTVKGRKNGSFKYIEADPTHPKESWKRDGFSWNQKGGWHVIYDNKLKRKTFTLQGDKSFKKSVTKLAHNNPHHDAVVVTYFYHPSENDDKGKKRKKEEIEIDDPSPQPTKKANIQLPPTVLQVCSCTHHNPQEEIIEQEKLLRHLIFGSLTENNVLPFEDFVSALVKHAQNLPQLLRARNPNSYDIPMKLQKSVTLSKDEARVVLAKFLGKTVSCIDFQRFWFMFGPYSTLMPKLKDVYSVYHARKELAEKQVCGKEKSRAIYPAPEPMCLVLTLYCSNEKRNKNYLLKNGDMGVQFQVSKSLWSVCYSTLSEMLSSNPALF